MRIFENRKVSILMLILLTLEIYHFSSLKGGSVGSSIPFLSIAYHSIVFFLFNFFLIAAIKGKGDLKLSIILTAITISIIHGFLDEFHQSFVPGRDSTIKDVFVDAMGIFASSIVYLLAERKKTEFNTEEELYPLSF